MVNKDRIVSSFIEHVKIDSPTKEEYNYAMKLFKDLEEMGFEVHMDQAGEKLGSNAGNIIAFKKGNSNMEPILFTAHMDTVSPARGIEPIIKDGIIKSKGDTILAADDKAGVVAILEGIKSVLEAEEDHPNIEVVFTIFEEGGLKGAKNLDYSQFESKDIAVLDSGGRVGGLINKAPGQSQIFVKYIGRSSHAGVAPEEGISAIQMAADAINNMKLLRIDEETTANIGIINGGEATNIVTEIVTIEAEARSTDEDKLEEQTRHMVETFKESADKFGGEIEVFVDKIYSSYKLDSDNPMIKRVTTALNSIGIEEDIMPTGGGSDANIWNANGFSAVNIAVGMELSHTIDEFIRIDDLIDASRLVYQLIIQS